MNKFKTGDKAVIKQNTTSHQFNNGTVVEIIKVGKDSDNTISYTCKGLDRFNDKKGTWFVSYRDLEPIKQKTIKNKIMSTEQKTKEQLLHAYKKANKERKKVIFAKAGFLDETSYLNFLLRKEEPKVENNKTSRRTKKKVPSVPLQKIVLHNVDISDATGSMYGAKYEKSKKGILAGIENLKKDPIWKFKED